MVVNLCKKDRGSLLARWVTPSWVNSVFTNVKKGNPSFMKKQTTKLVEKLCECKMQSIVVHCICKLDNKNVFLY